MCSKNQDFKSGFVSIMGASNTGKSTLLNAILDYKISIATQKPQTTRQNIKGILNKDNCQIIFMDTPGYLKPRYELHNKMLESFKVSMVDMDALIFMADMNIFPTEYDLEVIDLLEKVKCPKIMVLNKMDLNEKEFYLDEKYNSLFEKIIFISAKEKQNVDKLVDYIYDILPYGEAYYSKDELSDLPMKFFVAELIREQIFLKFNEEVPYCCSVETDLFKEKDNKIDIYANIWIEKKSQKIIIIGKNGEKIKAIRLAAEKEIYKQLHKRIKLTLWVKLKENWRNNKSALKDFGYN